MSQLADYVTQQIEHAKRMKQHNQSLSISEDQDTANYHNGVCTGLSMGIGDMESILNVVKEFEKIGAVK